MAKYRLKYPDHEGCCYDTDRNGHRYLNRTRYWNHIMELQQSEAPTDPNIKTNPQKMGWYKKLVQVLGWRDPILFAGITLLDVAVYKNIKNGAEALFPPEIALTWAIAISIMSWLFLTALAGRHHKFWRYVTLLGLRSVAAYFSFYTIYGQMESEVMETQANARANTAFSQTVISIMENHEREADELRGIANGFPKKLKEEKEDKGIGERYRALVREQAAAEGKADAAEAAIKRMKTLAVAPEGEPKKFFEAAMALRQACPQEWCADAPMPEVNDFIDPESQVSFMLPIKALQSKDEVAWVALIIVLLLDGGIILMGLMIEIPEKKRGE